MPAFQFRDGVSVCFVVVAWQVPVARAEDKTSRSYGKVLETAGDYKQRGLAKSNVVNGLQPAESCEGQFC